MSNKWEYATLGQAERLDMIKNGNTKVYNAEKSNNSMLRTERQKLGLSTSSIDAWDKAVDEAANYGRKTGSKLPSSPSVKESRVLNAMNNCINELQKQAEDDREKAVDEAVTAVGYITEWLVNNGYNVKDNTVKKRISEIEKKLERSLNSVNKSLNDKVSSATSKYVKML